METKSTYVVIPKLNKILKEKGITQMQLAEMSGVSQGAISRFDRNKQHLDLHLVAISRALGLTIEDLFEISEQLEIAIDDKFQ
ncbi:transcriptional regulator [Bacillus sp. 7586-K]|nr:transcriptional regulator [Bacillus sp. 7586-K]